MKFICYPKCTTCQKAKKWLDENEVEYEMRDIKQDNPNLEELRGWYKNSGLPLKKFLIQAGCSINLSNLKQSSLKWKRRKC